MTTRAKRLLICVLIAAGVCAILLGALACAWDRITYDEGVRLGKQIAAEAEVLRKSDQTELTFEFRPRYGVEQSYRVGIGKAERCDPQHGKNCAQAAVSVSVERGQGGSTTYAYRYVSVPAPLQIEKRGEATFVTLRKSAADVQVVALR